MPQTMEELVALIRQILDDMGKEKGVADAEADKGAAADPEKAMKDGEEEEAFAARENREAQEAGQSGDPVKAAEAVERAVEAAVEAVKTGAEGDASKESMDSILKAVKDMAKIVKAQDAQIRKVAAVDSAAVIADIKAAESLYKRVTPFVGNFDANPLSRSASGIAKYACDKLGLKPVKGQEVAALDGYLAAAEQVKTVDAKKVSASVKHDSWEV